MAYKRCPFYGPFVKGMLYVVASCLHYGKFDLKQQYSILLKSDKIITIF